MLPARRLTLFSAAILAALAAVLAVLLPPGIASAAGRPAAETRVWAFSSAAQPRVGADRLVPAGQRLRGPAPCPFYASGACVAPEEAGAGAGSTAERLAATCGGASFTAGTKILLASGAAVPIASLKPGEKVLATNVRTHKTQAEPVAAVLVHHDTNRYDLTVRTSHGSAVIHTTSNHLFFDHTQGRWVKARALRYGDHLRTPNGLSVTAVGGNTPANAAGWMWDLSVPGGNDHDFYVDVVSTAVLVHNCPTRSGQPFDLNQQALIQLAKEAKQLGGVSQQEGEILSELADEYGLGGHGPAIHPGRSGFGGTVPHINIGPIRHIPVIP